MPVKLLAILNYFLCSDNLRYFDQLIIVVRALEERLLLEHHASQHASRGPDVKLIIVKVVVHKKLWPFEVSRGYADIEPFTGLVDVRQAPVHNLDSLGLGKK